MCCISAKHRTLWRKSKDWLTQNQDNVLEWSDMSTNRLLFQLTSTIKKNPAKRVDLVQSGHHYHFID